MLEFDNENEIRFVNNLKAQVGQPLKEKGLKNRARV